MGQAAWGGRQPGWPAHAGWAVRTACLEPSQLQVMVGRRLVMSGVICGVWAHIFEGPVGCAWPSQLGHAHAAPCGARQRRRPTSLAAARAASQGGSSPHKPACGGELRFAAWQRKHVPVPALPALHHEVLHLWGQELCETSDRAVLCGQAASP